MKTIALFDYHSSGHHISYLRVFAEVLAELNYRVVVLTSAADEVGRSLAELDNIQVRGIKKQEFKFKFPLRRFAGFYDRKNTWDQTKDELEKAEQELGFKIEFVYFLWLDEFVTPVPIFTHKLLVRGFNYPWSGLAFHLKYRYLPNHVQGRLSGKSTDFFKLDGCKFVTTLDESMVPILSEAVPSKEFVALPDFATNEYISDEPTKLTEEIIEKARGRKIITLIGSIDRRKGLMPLIRLARKYIKNDWFFVVAGKFTPNFSMEEISEILNFVTEYPDNILFKFGYVTDEDFDAVLSITDIVYAAYLDFPSSSNMLIKAAIFKKPIVVSAGHLMGDRVEKYQMGEVVPQDDFKACGKAITKILTDPSRYGKGLRAYENDFSIDRLKEELDRLFSNYFKQN